jgi:hypothetical protein
MSRESGRASTVATKLSRRFQHTISLKGAIHVGDALTARLTRAPLRELPVDVTEQCRVKLEGGFHGASVMVSCKLAGQFSVQWSEAEGHFPAGQSNLYTLCDEQGKPEIDWIIRGLAKQHPHVVEKAEDAVGAKLVHGLLLANSERSVNLAVKLFKINPQLLLGTHGQHSRDKPVFSGEGSMHIVAVNKRLTAAKAMVRMAVRHLTPAQVLEMLSQSCAGQFFVGAPMCYFGGSVMSYLAVFGLLIPVLPLLESLPDERKAALACRGKLYHKYTAMHATVMAGRVPEFNALIKYGADEFALDADGYSPMRLAVKMGMRARCPSPWPAPSGPHPFLSLTL